MPEGKKQPESNGWSDVFARAPRLYLRLSLALDYAFTRGYFPEDAELPTLAWEPFVDNRIPNSLSPPSMFKTPRLPEAVAMESPICGTLVPLNTEDQPLRQPESPTHTHATSMAPVPSTYHPDSTAFDFNSMVEPNESPQHEALLAGQLPLTHNKRILPAQDHNQKEQCLDFLNFESPTPESRTAADSSGGDQGESYPGDELNAMGIDTFLDLSNEMTEACYSAFPYNEERRRYSTDNLNSMGVHTVMDFGEEMPLWSDHMLNEILSPISAQSGA